MLGGSVSVPAAVSAAQRRGPLELDRPAATSQRLSRETLQPISFRFGIEHAGYTIGVSGCGQRATYVALCPDQAGSTCFSAAGRDGIQ